MQGWGNGSRLVLSAILVIVLSSLVHQSNAEYHIDLKTSGSVVLGLNSTVEFYAVLYTDGALVNDDYVVNWMDNTSPQHKLEDVTSKSPRFNWTVLYSHPVKPGTYEVTVSVKKMYFIIPYPLATAKISFNLTSMLNGEMQLVQNETVINSTYISSTLPLNQTIALSDSDKKALEKAAYVNTFWFINCQYIGTSNELSTLSNFTRENDTYTIEALLVASFEKVTGWSFESRQNYGIQEEISDFSLIFLASRTDNNNNYHYYYNYNNYYYNNHYNNHHNSFNNHEQYNNNDSDATDDYVHDAFHYHLNVHTQTIHGGSEPRGKKETRCRGRR